MWDAKTDREAIATSVFISMYLMKLIYTFMYLTNLFYTKVMYTVHYSILSKIKYLLI